jgi:hypothetical protein
MASERGRGGSTGGIGLGGVVVMIVWSFWVGLIAALVGLIAFGGFAKGQWYRTRRLVICAHRRHPAAVG